MKEDIVNNLTWEYIGAARKVSMKRECLEIEKSGRMVQGVSRRTHTPRKTSCLEEWMESENLPEEIA